jgi:hypothetical protein
VVSYFFCYFSLTSTEQISPDSAGPFTSFNPVGFAILLLRVVDRGHCFRRAAKEREDISASHGAPPEF